MSNQVKFYIYTSIQKMMQKEDYTQLSRLAWEAATKKNINPTKILIRSWAHDTTMGKPDPKGMHYTICFKDRASEAKKEHIAYHAYVPAPRVYQLVSESFSSQKADSTPRKKGEVVWDDSKNTEIHDVVYGPPPASGSSSRPSSRGGTTAAKPPSNPPSRPSSRAGAAAAPPAASSRPSSRGGTTAAKPPSRPSSSGKR